jgi:hypothetical protein
MRRPVFIARQSAMASGLTGFLRGDSLERNRFPNEVYTFYDEQSVGAMFEASDFGAIQFSRIGEATPVLAVVRRQDFELDACSRG